LVITVIAMLRTLTIGDIARFLLAMLALAFALWTHAVGKGI